MAGGMNKRGSTGLPMAERVRLGRDPASTPASPPPTPACPARHCWVLDAADHTGEKRAGLLLEWRRGADGWEGQVVYLVRREGRGWLATVEWFPDSALQVAVIDP
ncbi:hypothetical protein KLP28_12325 [Nocardioidaceae bacterium]|nr:hypothetical protein KLP28_12325 [Nocardioidaceae bacterium]